MIWLRLICYCAGHTIGSVIGVFLALKMFNWIERREERKKEKNRAFLRRIGL